MSEKEEFQRFTISLPNDLFQSFEDFRNKNNLSRSDAIRKAMWEYTQKQTEAIRTLSDEHLTAVIIIYMTHAYPGDKHDHDQLSADEHSLMHQSKQKHSEHHQNHENHEPHDHHAKNDKGSGSDHNEIEEILTSTYFTYPDTDLIKINHLEHLFHDIVLTQLHVHADHEKCIVIIPVKGSGIRINEFYRNVVQLKSILSHQLIVEE
jgi:metal-responsive CopG/Arc/MetJ family transcriptional regulator